MGFVLKANCKKETFDCFPLLGILKAAARKQSCLSLTLGKSAASKMVEQQSSPKKFQLPHLFLPKPENKLYTRERVFFANTPSESIHWGTKESFWDIKWNSRDVTSEQSQQRA